MKNKTRKDVKKVGGRLVSQTWSSSSSSSSSSSNCKPRKHHYPGYPCPAPGFVSPYPTTPFAPPLVSPYEAAPFAQPFAAPQYPRAVRPFAAPPRPRRRPTAVLPAEISPTPGAPVCPPCPPPPIISTFETPVVSPYEAAPCPPPAFVSPVEAVPVPVPPPPICADACCAACYRCASVGAKKSCRYCKKYCSKCN